MSLRLTGNPLLRKDLQPGSGKSIVYLLLLTRMTQHYLDSTHSDWKSQTTGQLWLQYPCEALFFISQFLPQFTNSFNMSCTVWGPLRSQKDWKSLSWSRNSTIITVPLILFLKHPPLILECFPSQAHPTRLCSSGATSSGRAYQLCKVAMREFPVSLRKHYCVCFRLCASARSRLGTIMNLRLRECMNVR